MPSCYSPICTDTTRQTFDDYTSQLDIPQIDYIAIGVQNILSKTSASLMSNSDWQDYFTHNEYAHYDPIRKAVLQTRRNIISFSEIDHVDSYGKEIMYQRARHGICDGIILMQRNQKHNFMITLGTGFRGFDAYEFIKRHHDKIEVFKKGLIQIIEKDARIFLFDQANRLSSGAK